MNKKGFTLVELLAVMIIISIITIITIPIINGVVEKARKSAIEDSLFGIEGAIKLYYSNYDVKDNITFLIKDGQISSEDTSKMLEYKGKIDNGDIRVFEDGTYAICIEQDGLYALKNIKDKQITSGEGSCEFNQETNEYEGKQLGSSIQIFVDNTRADGIPTGLYNVSFDCKNATGKWNNIFKSIMFNNITNQDFSCKVYFTTCTDDVCDTSDDSWINWLELLGYNYKDYTSLNDFLTKEVSINSCSDIDFFYDNTNGAYDYLSSHDSLIAEINQTVDFSKCSKDFAYKGAVEVYNVPIDGLYKLEVWGAQGGYGGGKGGYSIGYKELSSGSNIYVCVGGAGSSLSGGYHDFNTNTKVSGGYNGGGTGGVGYYGTYGGGGGGATHIATMTGTLSAIGVSNKDKVLIVAGGGGGGSGTGNSSGGGLSGGSGQNGGGTQTSGVAFGQGGDNWGNDDHMGGGGGWYGGQGAVMYRTAGATAGGGSGYIAGVPDLRIGGKLYSAATVNGYQSGNGKAKITFAGIK